jgi:hypothetical protein
MPGHGQEMAGCSRKVLSSGERRGQAQNDDGKNDGRPREHRHGALLLFSAYAAFFKHYGGISMAGIRQDVRIRTTQLQCRLVTHRRPGTKAGEGNAMPLFFSSWPDLIRPSPHQRQMRGVKPAHDALSPG